MSASSLPPRPSHPFLSWGQQRSLAKLKVLLMKHAGLVYYDDESAIKLVAQFSAQKTMQLIGTGENFKLFQIQDDTASNVLAEFSGFEKESDRAMVMLQLSRKWIEQRFTSNGGFDVKAAFNFQQSLITMLVLDPRKVNYNSPPPELN